MVVFWARTTEPSSIDLKKIQARDRRCRRSLTLRAEQAVLWRVGRVTCLLTRASLATFLQPKHQHSGKQIILKYFRGCLTMNFHRNYIFPRNKAFGICAPPQTICSLLYIQSESDTNKQIKTLHSRKPLKTKHK